MLFMLWRGRSKVVSDKHINFILRKTTLEKLSIAAFSLGRQAKRASFIRVSYWQVGIIGIRLDFLGR